MSNLPVGLESVNDKVYKVDLVNYYGFGWYVNNHYGIAYVGSLFNNDTDMQDGIKIVEKFGTNFQFINTRLLYGIGMAGYKTSCTLDTLTQINTDCIRDCKFELEFVKISNKYFKAGKDYNLSIRTGAKTKTGNNASVKAQLYFAIGSNIVSPIYDIEIPVATSKVTPTYEIKFSVNLEYDITEEDDFKLVIVTADEREFSSITVGDISIVTEIPKEEFVDIPEPEPVPEPEIVDPLEPKFFNQTDNLQWLSDIGCVSLDETNVRLSGNIKTVISESGIFIESISSNDKLSNLSMKGFKCDLSLPWLENIAQFTNNVFGDSFGQWLHYQQPDDFNPTKNFAQQLQNIYRYGCYRQTNDLVCEHGLRFFAPLWTYGKLPARFTILRLNGITDNVVKESSDIRDAELVKSFDLSETSEYGKFLRTLTENNAWKDWSVAMNFEEGLGIYGISPKTGNLIFKQASEFEDLLANERTITEVNDYVTSLYEQYGMISHNLLNLEFAFDDPNAAYGFCTYIGVYSYESEISEESAKNLKSNTLILSKNFTDLAKFVYNHSEFKKLPNSFAPTGKVRHIVDTEFDVSDAMVVIDFKTPPVRNTRIQLSIDNSQLFEVSINEEDINSNPTKTLERLVEKIENDYEDIYAESYGGTTLVIYFPKFNGNERVEAYLPLNAVAHTTSTGSVLYKPDIKDCLVQSFVSGSDTIIAEFGEFHLTDTFQRFDKNVYLRLSSSVDMTELDTLQYLDLYTTVPSKLYLQHPLTHVRFQKDRYDIHTNFVDFNKSDYVAYALECINSHYNKTFATIDAICEDEELEKLGTNLKTYLSLIPDPPLSPQFLQSLPLQNLSEFESLSNPYDRLMELQWVIDKVNKKFAQVPIFANIHGTDSYFMPYTLNLALPYGTANFVPEKYQRRSIDGASHNWYALANGYGYCKDFRKAMQMVNANVWKERLSINDKGEVVLTGHQYAETATDCEQDMFKALKLRVGTIDNYKDLCSWSYLRKADGYEDTYYVMYMGVEYWFQGNYEGYRFATIFVSETKNRNEEFEIIENAEFKTLTLFVYSYIYDDYLTTFQGAAPYYLDRSVLYFADRAFLETGDNHILEADSDLVSLDFLEYNFEEGRKVYYNGLPVSFPQHLETPNGEGISEIRQMNSFVKIEIIDGKSQPIFFVKNTGVETDPLTAIINDKTFKWFMLYEYDIYTFKLVEFTAHDILLDSLTDEGFWCKDITMEFFPEGVPGYSSTASLAEMCAMVDENSDPLFPNLNNENFYNEVMDRGIKYDGNKRYLSLKNDFFWELPTPAVNNESLWNHFSGNYNSFVKTINGKHFLYFGNDISYLADKYDNFIKLSNIWFAANQISQAKCYYLITSGAAIQNKYVEISFDNLRDKLTKSPIPYTIASKNNITGVTDYVYTKRQMYIHEADDSIIIVSLGRNRSVNGEEQIVRTNYIEFLMSRMNSVYGPVFEILMQPGSDNYAESYIFNHKFIAQNSPLNDKTTRYEYKKSIERDVKLNLVRQDTSLLGPINSKPYFASGIELPFEICPINVQNYFSIVFNYRKEFTIICNIENGVVDVLNVLYEQLYSQVFTNIMTSNIDAMSYEDKTLAFKPGNEDIISENVHIFDVKLLAFRRFYDEVFAKFYSIKSVTDARMKYYDFYQSNYTLKLYDTSFSGVATLLFRYN